MKKDKKATKFNLDQRLDLSNSKLNYPLQNLFEAQLNSYKRFIEEDLTYYFNLINPIMDNTGKLWMLEFIKPHLYEATRTEGDCLRKGLTFEAPLYWSVRLVNKQTGELKEQEIFMGEIPLMTERGTFIISGSDRCIAHQIIRAEGVIFLPNGIFYDRIPLSLAKIIPYRGAWFTVDISKTGVISARFGPKKPRINICTLLRAMGYGSNAEILNLFKHIQVDEDQPNFIELTLAKDPTDSSVSAIFDIYRRLRPDVTATVENAKAYIESLLFDPKRFYLGDVGRYQLNKKLDEKYRKEVTEENYGLFYSDIIGVIEKLIKVNLGKIEADDTDHLGNRRIRSVNELLGEVVMDAVKKIEKNTKDKMSLHSTDELLTASDVMNSRPLVTAFRDFFGSSQISRYMTQKNVLSELSNLRYVTAGGPHGLTKERATFSVRDVHYSQYGRFCPVQTPDGQSVGVVNHLSAFARVNKYGFIEVPYRKLVHDVKPDKALNRILAEDTKVGSKTIRGGAFVDEKISKELAKIKDESIRVRPFVSDEIEYLDADKETEVKITLTSIGIDENLNIMDDLAPTRYKGEFYTGSVYELEYIDVDPISSAGINFALIPFGHHTDVARNVFEVSNMNQAIPLIKPESPIVGTGREDEVAKLSGRSLYAKNSGVVEYVDAKTVVVKTDKGKDTYNLINFQGSNDVTLIHHTARVDLGQKVKEGDLIADGSSAYMGELAIGTNILCACMFYEGITFEDGFAISERLMKQGTLDGVLIKTYSRDIRDTKLGPEVLTADIPGVSEGILGNLDENGIVRKGAKVKSGDILVGVVAPRGDLEISAEEKLLRAIFGESAHDVKNVSLNVPNGEAGIVIDTKILERENDELGTGVLKQVKVWVARIHSINIGDKLCDMAGQKGVISKIIPEENMPYLEDGTPVDLIFSPLFLKRMNVSILREMSLSMRAKKAGVKVKVPLFTSPDESIVDDILKEKGIVVNDKYTLYDGRTGEKFDNQVSVGWKYILKIEHLAEDKVHARSTGPYTIVTQQPLGGKAQFGGQRFGEMEVWALEAHGAANVLQEMLTIKSDDIEGRSKSYEAIIHGNDIKLEGTPESFKVFISELRSLCLDIDLKDSENPSESAFDIKRRKKTTFADLAKDDETDLNEQK